MRETMARVSGSGLKAFAPDLEEDPLPSAEVADREGLSAAQIVDDGPEFSTAAQDDGSNMGFPGQRCHPSRGPIPHPKGPHSRNDSRASAFGDDIMDDVSPGKVASDRLRLPAVRHRLLSLIPIPDYQRADFNPIGLRFGAPGRRSRLSHVGILSGLCCGQTS